MMKSSNENERAHILNHLDEATWRLDSIQQLSLPTIITVKAEYFTPVVLMRYPPWMYNPPTDPWLHVLYQDEHIIAVNKPSGLLSVPGKAPEHNDALCRVLKQNF